MEIKDYLHLYIGCEVIVDIRRYLGNSTGKNVDLSSVRMRFDSINRSSDIDQCWGVTKSDGIEYYNCFDELCRLYDHFVHSSNLKPILRPLSNINANDLIALADIIRPENIGNHPRLEESFEDQVNGVVIAIEKIGLYRGPIAFQMTRYLLKQGFDLFGLIPAGLAIDKTSLKN